MNFHFLTRAFFLLLSISVFAQDDIYSAYTIPEELTKNANAVIRNSSVEVELHSYSSMTVKSKRVITILNKNGLNQLDTYLHYDPERKVKSIKVNILNALGEETEKFRRKDFNDFSASGGDLYSDNRILVLNYTPKKYPFTAVFEYEMNTTSTAFLPRWYPVENYFISTEHSTFTLASSSDVVLDVKESLLEEFGIEKYSSDGLLKYQAENLPALKWEAMAPTFSKVVPNVMVSLQRFRLVNVDGVAKSWEEFGKWNYHNLIKGRGEISEKTKAEIESLVAGINDPIEKAKKIYQFVQEKTRYISVQLGVGGWQPMLASEVDDLSYGDCKALTNYTMALLENQGIKAYYSVVYGDSDIRDIDSSFVGMQGNHVILNIPNGDDNIWLECTSQKVPFNHIAGFTDDRDVLVVTPEGGIIKHTKVYESNENYSKVVAEISLNDDGGFNANFTEKAAGTRYDSRLRVLESDSEDQNLYYNERWDYLNAISLEDIDFSNDYEAAEIKASTRVQAKSYGSIVTDKMLVKPNIFDRSSYVPPRYSKRNLPLQIQRGYLNESTFEWELPAGFEVASVPEQVELKTKFGTYSFSIERIDDSKLVYKRKLEIFKGDHQKTDYKDYRSFRREITKADKVSIVLKRKTE